MVSGSPRSAAEILVLLSGGVDSMACADFYRTMGRPVCGLFVDYGQLAAHREFAAASAVANHLGIELTRLALNGSTQPKTAGEIPTRNAFLVCLAAMECPLSVLGIAIGIHAGTQYADCTPGFVTSAKTLLSFHSRPVDVLAPFVDWKKEQIMAYALSRHLPLKLTYSCERGADPPCGSCLSCLDRRLIDDRA
jgi:7-cyano-7-deazaguanine synthase